MPKVDAKNRLEEKTTKQPDTTLSDVVDSEIAKGRDSYLLNWLVGIHVLISFSGMIIENTFQNYLQELQLTGSLSPEMQGLLDRFFNHIGNVTDGFVLCGLSAVFGYIALELIDEDELSIQMRRSLQNMLPVLIAILFTVVQVAVETPNGFVRFGYPNPADIPAGMYGMISGLSLYYAIRKQIEKQKETPFNRLQIQTPRR